MTAVLQFFNHKISVCKCTMCVWHILQPERWNPFYALFKSWSAPNGYLHCQHWCKLKS